MCPFLADRQAGVSIRLYVPFKHWHLLIMSTLKLSPLSMTLKISPLIFELSEMNLCPLADRQTRDQHKLCTLFDTTIIVLYIHLSFLYLI